MQWSNFFSFITGFFAQVSFRLEPAIIGQDAGLDDVQVLFPPTTTLAAPTPLRIQIFPTNVDVNVIKDAVATAMQAGQVRDALRGTRHRLLQVENLHSWRLIVFGQSGADKRDQNGFRAAVADYTNGRTVYIDSADAFGTPSTLTVTESNVQPSPNQEEVAEAAVIAGFGLNAIARTTMPPLKVNIFPNGTSHRILNILVRAASSNSNEMLQYLVNMNNKTAERVPTASFAQLPPETDWCKVYNTDDRIAPGNQTTPKGLPGAASVKVFKQGESQPLWELTVVRPSASRGRLGSGIDIRNVMYKGKRVLGQGHLPILNVQYKEEVFGCGPTYRDWQFDEFPFECEGNNVTGTDYLRICKNSPKTLVDAPPPKNPGQDKENATDFRGVGFYATEDAVLIRSQLRAGWYRYTSDWTLCANGTIKPRWGFGGTLEGNHCVCRQHHHHAYFRFDFDIETNYGNSVHEYNPPQGNRPGNWFEIKQAVHSKRAEGTNNRWQEQKWRVSNTRTKNSYLMLPGPRDKNTLGDSFGIDGAWIMKYDGNFIDDGMPNDSINETVNIAQMQRILDGSGGQQDSTIPGRDVVIWYAAHFLHDERRESDPSQKHDWKHLYGPDLVPEKWV